MTNKLLWSLSQRKSNPNIARAICESIGQFETSISLLVKVAIEVVNGLTSQPNVTIHYIIDTLNAQETIQKQINTWSPFYKYG